MKTLLNKKLCFFIPIAIGMFFFSAADAQIVYTDVNPDSTIHGSYPSKLYDLDLNNDGVTHFRFGIQTFTTSRCGAECGKRIDNYVVVSPASGSKNEIRSEGYPPALQELAIIDSPQTLWSGASGQWLRHISGCEYCGGFQVSGQWDTTADRYLGLKLITGGHTYYGWARLSVNVSSSSATLTIRDYACNSIPNQPIRAGETNCTAPTVTLSKSGPLNFCAGDSVTFAAKGTGYKYQWKQNGKNISGATSKKYVAKIAGIYKCKVTNSCGSVTSTGKKVTVTCKGLLINTEISDEKIISLVHQFTVYPNPFSNSTTISFSIPQSEKVSISIFDMSGRLVKIFANAEMQSGVHQRLWNAKDEKGNKVSAGIYFVRMQTGNYAEMKKIVVVK